MHTTEEFRAYVERHNIRVLVVFEHSGALLEELRRRGVPAMSVDKREPLHNGPHYQGDMMDVIPLKEWEQVWFVGPNCFQAMRADAYLPNKIADGRTFWAIARVAWCICCPYAREVLVEQPDTIAEDFIQASKIPGVEVREMRTVWFGDVKDKYMRLTTVNLRLPPTPRPGDRPRTTQKPTLCTSQQRNPHRSE